MWASQMVRALSKCSAQIECHTLNYLGAARDIFCTRMKGFFCGCDMNTYSDWQLSLAGAQQSIDSAVEQLVIMEADVTGIRANHHRVFFRYQVQIVRPFLCQEVKKITAIRPEGYSLNRRRYHLWPKETRAALKWHAGTFADTHTHTSMESKQQPHHPAVTQRKPAENPSMLGSTSA